MAECISDLQKKWFLISNFRRVLNVVCLLLGNSPASEFYMPTFRNTLSHLHWRIGMKMGKCVPKRRHIKFRRRGITQKKAYYKRSCFAQIMVFASFPVYSLVHRFGIVPACSTDVTIFLEKYTGREKNRARSLSCWLDQKYQTQKSTRAKQRIFRCEVGPRHDIKYSNVKHTICGASHFLYTVFPAS